MSGRTTPARVAQGLLLVTVSVAVTLLAAEVALRFLWDGFYAKYPPPRPGGLGAADFHPTRAWTPAPDLEVVSWDPEFRVVRRHDALGFRGDAFPLEKAPGRIRVLAIGDSFTYGHGVADDEPWGPVLASLDPRLEVINAGVGGYDTGQELVTLREEVPRLDPDLVVVAYFYNDLWDTYDGAYVHFELRDGRLHQIPADPPTLEHPSLAGQKERYDERSAFSQTPLAQSRLYRLVSDRMKILSAIIESFTEEPDTRVPDARRSAEEEEGAWQLAFALLQEMDRIAREHGAAFAVLVIPDQTQVEPGVEVHRVPRILPKVQGRLTAFGAEAGIPVIDALPALVERRGEAGERFYFRRDRHLNPLGQRHLAEVLLAELRRLGMLPPPAG